MEEDVDYEYWLSAMVGKFIHFLRDGDLRQDSLRLLVRFCCFDFLFLSAWFLTRRSFWRYDLDSEHHTRELTLSVRVFAGWRYVELFFIHPAYRSRLFVSAESSE